MWRVLRVGLQLSTTTKARREHLSPWAVRVRYTDAYTYTHSHTDTYTYTHSHTHSHTDTHSNTHTHTHT